MSDIGPQRATPKSLSALKAELQQKMNQINWTAKYSDETIEEMQKVFAGLKEKILSEPEKGQAPDWIKETELYKSFERTGCYIHYSESGVLVVDPSIIQKCNF